MQQPTDRAFLLIGAMKAGTTSLFNDLARNTAIAIPEKEPAYLTRYDVPGAIAAYCRLFRAARADQMVGEASTGYSMLPRFKGVPERARACFGRNLKIVYLVRNPILRALSHHYHAWSYGGADRDPETALRGDPDLIAVSRYAMQLDPWLQTFQAGQIRVVIAEEYYKARAETVDEIFRFLNVPNSGVADFAWHNRGESRSLGRWNVVRRNHWYRTRIKPWIPASIRAGVSRLLLSPAPARPDPPRVECLQRICEALIPDVEALTRVLARPVPPWDLPDTVQALAARRGRT